jgi:ABC-2 type transport system permease protein
MLRGRRALGAAALAAVPGIVAWVASANETIDRDQVFIGVTATLPGATLSLAVLFLGTAVLRDERDGGTLPFLFITPMSRWTFSLSAWVAAAVGAVMVVAAGWLPVLAAAGLGAGSWSLAWPVLVTYVGAALAYTAVFVPLGYLFDRSLLVGLPYVFVWEGIIVSFVPGLSASSIWRIALTIYADLAEFPRGALDALGSLKPGVGGAAVTIGIIIALGVSLLAWAVRRRDAV